MKNRIEDGKPVLAVTRQGNVQPSIVATSFRVSEEERPQEGDRQSPPAFGSVSKVTKKAIREALSPAYHKIWKEGKNCIGFDVMGLEIIASKLFNGYGLLHPFSILYEIRKDGKHVTNGDKDFTVDRIFRMLKAPTPQPEE